MLLYYTSGEGAAGLVKIHGDCTRAPLNLELPVIGANTTRVPVDCFGYVDAGDTMTP